MSEVSVEAEPGESQGPQEEEEEESPEMGSEQPELTETEPGQSELSGPDDYSISARIVTEKEARQKELRKLLTGRDADDEEQFTFQPPQTKSSTAVPKKAGAASGLKLALINQERIKAERKRDLLTIERQRAQLEMSLKKNRADIKRVDKAIEAKNRHLVQLEKIIERERFIYEEFLRSTEKKSEDARTLFEKENKCNQEMNADIEMFTDNIGTLKSELTQIEEILNEYKRYKDILFKLSPLEWQRSHSLKARAPVSEQMLQKAASDEGLESSPGGGLPVSEEDMLSPSDNHTLDPDSKPDSDSSESEQQLELYFSNAQPLLDLMMELTEQNLSLIQNATSSEALEELRQTISTNKTKMKEEEDNLTVQVNELTDRIEKEVERAAVLKKKVQLHDSLRTEDQDVLLDGLGMKVNELYCCCVDSRLTNLSTLEKLSRVEYRMTLLLQNIENIPEENLDTLRKIKDSERRTRLREEQLRLEREKKKERLIKCMKRSLGDPKKKTGRKLMPRCILVEQKVKVSEEDTIPAEDELHAYLYTEDE